MEQSASEQVAAIKYQVSALCRQGNFQQAKKLLLELEQQVELDADTCLMLGSIRGQLGEFEEAVRCCQNALQLDPGNLQAYLGLGRAMIPLGRLSEAESAFRAALERQVDLIGAILDLGLLLMNQGRIDEAVTYFEQAAEIDSCCEKALFGLGKAYLAKRKPELARNYLDRLIGINPKHVGAHYQLGCLCYNQGQVDESAEHYNEAIAINPRHVNALKDLGYLHLSMNRPLEAKKAFEDALSVQPENLDVIAGLAKLYDQSGDLQRAFDLIRHHIETGVRHADLGIVYANICRHFDRCEDAVAYLEGLVELTENRSFRNDQIYFALGKLYDHLGEYDKAFNCFERGNLKKESSFNLVEEAACIDRLVEVCDWNFFVSAPRSRQRSERPVFIVGMPRSGTTLTEQILASHPDVDGVGEVIVFPNIVRNLSSVLGQGSAYPENLKNLSRDILDELSDTYLTEIENLGGGGQRVTDKTLVNYLYLGLISLMFPNSRIIHCVRDPRDTCLSIFFQNFDESHYYANRLSNLGAYYSLYRRVMAHWKSLIDIPLLEICYEDLVNDQEAKSRELIEFVGLDWDDCVLRFYESKRNVVTASYDQVRQKIYSRSTSRWKNYKKHVAPLVDALDFPLE